MRVYDIAIVGGGASGLAAAVGALRRGALVVLLERGARVGRKLLATGDGRCNLTNTSASPGDYHGHAPLLEGAMAAFSPEQVMAFFESIGLLCQQRRGGRVYPLCDQAAAVLDALRFAVLEAGGEVVCDFDAKRIDREGAFTVTAADGRSVGARRVILATGGPASPSLGGTDAGFALFRQLGHRVTRLLPALAQLETAMDFIRPLKGVRIDGHIALEVDAEPAISASGDILFTEYGLSGTAVMALSREAALALSKKRRVEAVIRSLDAPAGSALLFDRRAAMPARPLSDFLTGVVNKRLGQTLIKAAGITPLSREAGELTDAQLRAIWRMLTDFRVPVTGTRGFAAAQACAGGADGRQFDPQTLMSRLVPGLFACGEALDVDGDCGGFNLQWAWASGLFAAQNAALSLPGHSRPRPENPST